MDSFNSNRHYFVKVIGRIGLIAVFIIVVILIPPVSIANMDCNTKYDNCIKKIISMNSCINSERRICIDSCYIAGGDTVRCYFDECQFEDSWERRCRDKIKMEEEDCRNKQKSCSNNG